MKRGGPLRRGAQLKRATKLKPKRETPRRVAEDRVRDDEYRRAVRALRCYAGHYFGDECSGASDPDHQGKDRGAGLKASDYTCVPMCRKHHDQRQFMHGLFKGWTKGEMDTWCEAAIADTQERLRGFRPH